MQKLLLKASDLSHERNLCIAAYLIFWPIYYEGLAGMPRRYMDYSNWPGDIPEVYRWPYDYSYNGREFIPQTEEVPAGQ